MSESSDHSLAIGGGLRNVTNTLLKTTGNAATIASVLALLGLSHWPVAGAGFACNFAASAVSQTRRLGIQVGLMGGEVDQVRLDVELGSRAPWVVLVLHMQWSTLRYSHDASVSDKASKRSNSCKASSILKR